MRKPVESGLLSDKVIGIPMEQHLLKHPDGRHPVDRSKVPGLKDPNFRAQGSNSCARGGAFETGKCCFFKDASVKFCIISCKKEVEIGTAKALCEK